MVVGVLGLLLSFKVLRVFRHVEPWCQVGRRPEALGSQAVDGLVQTPGPVWGRHPGCVAIAVIQVSLCLQAVARKASSPSTGRSARPRVLMGLGSG